MAQIYRILFLTSFIYEQNVGARIYSHKELHYDYRYSTLKGRNDKRFMVLLATFKLKQENPSVIQEQMAEYNTYRKRTQPPGASLGSIFKNPPNDYAGRLIEDADLKGYQIGDVQVSPVHANFFINLSDKATAKDYYSLIEHVQTTVYQQTGIELELEIQTLGDWN